MAIAPPAAAPPPLKRPPRSLANRLLLVGGLFVTLALIALGVSQTTGSTEEEFSPTVFTVPTAPGETNPPPEPTSTLPPDTGPPTTLSPDGVQIHVPEEISPTCAPNPDVVGGSVVDAVDCSPTGDAAPSFVTYALLTDQAAADDFYDTLIGNNQVPVGECGDQAPRDCTYNEDSDPPGRYADFVVAEGACRLWTDDEFPVVSYACRADTDFDLMDTWWSNAGPV
jgi:hypothetical protein